MKTSVLLFAKAREIADSDRVVVEVTSPATLMNLKQALVTQFPSLEPLASTLLWAVNNRYATDDAMITESDTVACFPPVSGG